MEVTLIRENPDGSADFQFDMTAEEIQLMVNLGIMTAIKNGLEEAKNYVAEQSESSMGDTGSGEPSCKDGTGEQSHESGQCRNCPKAP